MPFILSSPAFAPGTVIPAEYTCDGADISPPLSWSGTPAGTGSLVLVVEDPDAPGGTFYHWAVFDIAPNTAGLAAGSGAGGPAAGLHEARNSFGESDYRGPCPPPGPAHHYRFRLLAINQPRLDLTGSTDVAAVLTAAQAYVVGEADLVGTFGR